MATTLVTFGGLKERLKALINRPRQLTDELAGDFINQAIADFERTLRIASMERVLQATMDGELNYIPVPADYLQLIELFTDDGTLTQVDLREWQATPDLGGRPEVFVKVADRIMLRPTPAAGTTIYMYHYAQANPLVVDTDRNTWTQSATSAVLYSAAEHAAMHWQDDARANLYRAKAQQYRDDLDQQDLMEEMAGPMRVRNAPGNY